MVIFWRMFSVSGNQKSFKRTCCPFMVINCQELHFGQHIYPRIQVQFQTQMEQQTIPNSTLVTLKTNYHQSQYRPSFMPFSNLEVCRDLLDFRSSCSQKLIQPMWHKTNDGPCGVKRQTLRQCQEDLQELSIISSLILKMKFNLLPSEERTSSTGSSSRADL